MVHCILKWARARAPLLTHTHTHTSSGKEEVSNDVQTSEAKIPDG